MELVAMIGEAWAAASESSGTAEVSDVKVEELRPGEGLGLSEEKIAMIEDYLLEPRSYPMPARVSLDEENTRALFTGLRARRGRG